jgi:hypothetical protein
MIRVCCSLHEEMVNRGTISGGLFRCRMDSGDPYLRGHEHVKERYEEGVVRFFVGLFRGEFLID